MAQTNVAISKYLLRLLNTLLLSEAYSLLPLAGLPLCRPINIEVNKNGGVTPLARG
jgi:hypothetical protein